MIKTILKHYIFDRLLNSMFDNVISVFTPFNPVIKVGDTYKSIEVSYNNGTYDALNETTTYFTCIVEEVSGDTIRVTPASVMDAFYYESLEMAEYMYTKHNLGDMEIDDNMIYYDYLCFTSYAININDITVIAQ